MKAEFKIKRISVPVRGSNVEVFFENGTEGMVFWCKKKAEFLWKHHPNQFEIGGIFNPAEISQDADQFKFSQINKEFQQFSMGEALRLQKDIGDADLKSLIAGCSRTKIYLNVKKTRIIIYSEIMYESVKIYVQSISHAREVIISIRNIDINKPIAMQIFLSAPEGCEMVASSPYFDARIETYIRSGIEIAGGFRDCD